MNKVFIKADPKETKFDLNPGMYGIFYEEINHSGDGGLYAELVRNRNFNDATICVGFTKHIK